MSYILHYLFLVASFACTGPWCQSCFPVKLYSAGVSLGIGFTVFSISNVEGCKFYCFLLSPSATVWLLSCVGLSSSLRVVKRVECRISRYPDLYFIVSHMALSCGLADVDVRVLASLCLVASSIIVRRLLCVIVVAVIQYLRAKYLVFI